LTATAYYVIGGLNADREEFKNRTGKLVEQYNAFEPLEGIFVNGEFTLGENIGDLGGISIALRAYQMSLNGEASPVLGRFYRYATRFHWFCPSMGG